MSKYPCSSHLHDKLSRVLSNYKLYIADVLIHKSFVVRQAFSKTFEKIKFSLESNLKIFTETIMPVKPPSRPIDAIRGLFEEQQLQINDLTEIIKKQAEKISRLEAKHKEILKKESEVKPSGWFFA